MPRIVAMLLPLLLIACSAGAPPAPQPPATPPGSDALAQVGRWTLQGATDAQGARIDAAFPHGRAVHGLVFEGGRIGITGGCNHIGGAYAIDAEGRLVVGPLVSTARACVDDEAMTADAVVSDLVSGTSAWRIAESWPEQLFLDHDDARRSAWIAERPGRD